MDMYPNAIGVLDTNRTHNYIQFNTTDNFFSIKSFDESYKCHLKSEIKQPSLFYYHSWYANFYMFVNVRPILRKIKINK